MGLSDLPTATQYGEDLSGAYPVIDLAIFNAGVMACPLDRIQQGLEWQLGVNRVGHFGLLQRII